MVALGVWGHCFPARPSTFTSTCIQFPSLFLPECEVQCLGAPISGLHQPTWDPSCCWEQDVQVEAWENMKETRSVNWKLPHCVVKHACSLVCKREAEEKWIWMPFSWDYGHMVWCHLFSSSCSAAGLWDLHTFAFICHVKRGDSERPFFCPSARPCSQPLTSLCTLPKEQSWFSEQVQPDCRSGLSSSNLFLLNFSVAPDRTFAIFQQQKGMDLRGEGRHDVHSATCTQYTGSWMVRFYCYNTIFSVL